MAETSIGVSGVVGRFLGSAAAGFAFGEAASLAVNPPLTEDDILLSAATTAARRAGSTGVGVVAACLAFTSVLLSLGSSFLLSAVALELLSKAGVRTPWLSGATTGASVMAGAVTAGLLAGILPPWLYATAQGILVLAVYSCSDVNDMTKALLIIFTTLFLSVLYGRMGVIIGLLAVGMTISVLCALRKALTERSTQKPKSPSGCKLLERIFFYSVVVGILGFSVGVGAGESGAGQAGDVVLMLQSVLWVSFLVAGLLGAGLGTVAMVGFGPEAPGKVAVAAAALAPAALRAILKSSSTLGPRGCMGGTLGVAAAAGVSLGAASVAAKEAFGSRRSTLAVLVSVAAGAFVGARGTALDASPATTSEVVSVALTAAGAFVLGAPRSPFHTRVNLQTGLLTGTELIKGIGMETVIAAAAPIGAGALGAAALGTAALGRIGTVGVLVAIALALGSTLSGMIGKSPSATSAHRN